MTSIEIIILNTYNYYTNVSGREDVHVTAEPEKKGEQRVIKFNLLFKK